MGSKLSRSGIFCIIKPLVRSLLMKAGTLRQANKLSEKLINELYL